MIITNVTVGGTTHNDYQRMSVKKLTADYNGSSNFTINYDSPFGRHKTDFSVGQEVIIKADNVNGTTNLLTGILERVEFTGSGTSQRVILKGRDYSQRLQDNNVEPVVYTDSEVSTIVTNIISNNLTDITTTNVDVTTTTLKRIAFNNISVFQALKQLAELSGFFFYVDSNKDLHFEKRNNVSSGLIFDNTNMHQALYNQTREQMANDIVVYGDRAFAGYQEDFTADGAGSEFTLLSKPRNTEVIFSGTTSTPKIGGVFELTTSPVSGTNAAEYLVSFNDKKIIFVSGTELGYSKIPANNTIVQVKYDRDIPIIKRGRDRASIALYGKKEKVINDKSINDPNTALDILKTELKNSNPYKGVELSVKGWYSITPGNTARVTLSDFNIDDEIAILDVTYIFDANSVQSEKVINVRLDRKIIDINDEIVNIRNRLQAIEEADRQPSDILTRLEFSEDDFSVVGSSWYVLERSDLGSSFILGKGYHGVTGDTFGGILGSVIASGVNFLGDSRVALAVVRSGGFYA